MSASWFTVIKQGLFYPKHFIQGRIQKSTRSIDDLEPGKGAIVELNGKKVAAYKNEKQHLITLSPICTHLGCVVGWNNLDKTWDCPCHGSRYNADGTVKRGPAKRSLKKIDGAFGSTFG